MVGEHKRNEGKLFLTRDERATPFFWHHHFQRLTRWYSAIPMGARGFRLGEQLWYKLCVSLFQSL
jgi:hypothetical protein